MDYSTLSAIQKGHTKLESFEPIFKEKTGIEYKDFLHTKFIEEDMTKFEIGKLIGLTQSQIQSHLYKYDITKQVVKLDEGKVFSNTPTDIEKQTGRKFIDIILELTDQGMSPTEITNKLKLRKITMVSQKLFLHEYNKKYKALKDEDLLLPELKGKSYKTIEKGFRDKLGIEYKDWLHQKYIIEGLSPFDISLLLGISVDAIRDRFKVYNLKKTTSQARQDAMRIGNIDYNKITSKARKTRNKFEGSNKQDQCRMLVKYYLEEFINKLNDNDIEVIVGYNEYGILKNVEVDIPVIVINKDKFRKYSIELNGEFWHDKENRIIKDTDKENRLIKSNWNHFILLEEDKKGTDMTDIENKTKLIIDNIIKDIETNLL